MISVALNNSRRRTASPNPICAPPRKTASSTVLATRSAWWASALRAASSDPSSSNTIADDETASTSISLSASPYSLSEDAGVSEITVTATLDGKVLDEDASVLVDIDETIDETVSQATRDVDYSVLYKVTLTIPAGEVSGSLTMLIDPNTDDEEEGNEIIELTVAIVGLTDGTGQIIITDVAAMMDDGTPVIDPLAFAEGTMIEAVGVTAGSPMSAVVLPEAEGEGDIAYSVSDLPAGLAFDDSTRTLSGSPTGDPKLH